MKKISYITISFFVFSAHFGYSQVIIESLKDGYLPATLEIIGPGSSSVLFGSDGAKFSGQGMVGNSDGRAYMRTKTTDNLLNSFRAEVTLKWGGGTNPINQIAFFGIGANDVNSAWYYEPTRPGLEITPHTLVNGSPDFDGRISIRDLDDQGGGNGWNFAYNQSNFLLGDSYRLALTWDSSSKNAVFDIDWAYNGSFDADASITVYGGDNGFNSSNSRIYIGGSDGITFSDLNIVPEPSALSLLAVGLGGLAMIRRRRS